ncbi:MAG: hypothetical protein ACRDJY_04555 [Thermoleophilaceae bacterium]
MTRAIRRLPVLLAVSFVVAAGCGDDDDDSDTPGAAQDQGSASVDSQAAEQLETYLKKHTRKIKGEQTRRGAVISYVEAVDGELNIWTRLNAASVVDEKPARQVCRIAIASDIPEAEGAHLLDAGAEEFTRCERGQPATESSSSPAQTCVHSWNAEANGAYQTVLAGIISASGADPEKLRVGTWPEAESTVRYRSAEDAFGDATGRSTVPSGACLIVLPSSQAGEETFFEDHGNWYMVATADAGEKFPLAAKRSIADAETATADALGKVTLN